MEDLVAHANDFEARTGFTYSILDGGEVIGCIYIYPDRRPEHDASISSWVRESYADFDLGVREELSTWIDQCWPFSSAHYAGIK